MSEHLKQNSRFPLIDFTRGIAIIWMIIFHLAYDLNFFKFVKINFQTDPFWYPFPRAIVFLFLICVGMSLRITHGEKILWKKAQKRFLKIISYAFIISIATYILYPKNWIFFGTLHCIAFSSLIGTLFVKYPRFSFILGLITIIQHFIFQWTWINWQQLFGVRPMDYIPLYPWLAVVLLGIGLHHFNFHQIKFKFLESKIGQFISCLGVHSLKIYLIHQIVLFFIVWGLALLFKPSR